MAKKIGNIILDMDEVIVNISPIVYRMLRDPYREFFKDVFEDKGDLTDEEILQRPSLFLENWLIKEDLKEDFVPGNPFFDFVISMIIELIYKKDFYDLLKPTQFANEILNNPLIMNSGDIKKVYIVTKVFKDAPEMIDYKIKFLNKHFPQFINKIELIGLTENEKKSEIIINKNLDFELIVDDSLENIIDYITNPNLNIDNKEILMPALGYNQEIPPEIVALAIKRNISFSSYNNIL